MADRVTTDPTLRGSPQQKILQRPIVIVEQMDNGSQQYFIHANELDPNMTRPEMFGILLSDLLDHIVASYRVATGRDERALRDSIFKVMKDENRFKDADPSRGNARGSGSAKN